MEDNEEWRAINGYEGGYEVSSHGRVKSFKRDPRGQILKPGVSGGYPYVSLSKDGELKPIRVHQLVAEAFLGPCPEGREVSHVDHTRDNCHVSNLEYLTHKENMQHAARFARHRGDLSVEQVQIIREIFATNPKAKIKEVSKQLGIPRGHISRVLNLRSYALVPNADGSPPEKLKRTLTVEDITSLQAQGMTLPQISRHYGVEYSTPYQILGRAKKRAEKQIATD